MNKDITDAATKLANDDCKRKQLVIEAKKKGWSGVTVDTTNFDLDNIYQKIVDFLATKQMFDKDDISLINLLRAYRNDKVDLQKFMMTM